MLSVSVILLHAEAGREETGLHGPRGDQRQQGADQGLSIEGDQIRVRHGQENNKKIISESLKQVGLRRATLPQ